MATIKQIREYLVEALDWCYNPELEFVTDDNGDEQHIEIALDINADGIENAISLDQMTELIKAIDRLDENARLIGGEVGRKHFVLMMDIKKDAIII